MANRALPDSWLLCPCCGRCMSAVEVAVATPPFTMELIGCQDCGITANDLTAPPGAAGGPSENGYGTD